MQARQEQQQKYAMRLVYANGFSFIKKHKQDNNKDNDKNNVGRQSLALGQLRATLGLGLEHRRIRVEQQQRRQKLELGNW